MNKKYILKEDVKGEVSEDVIIVKKVKEVTIDGNTIPLYSPENQKVKELKLFEEGEDYENSTCDKG